MTRGHFQPKAVNQGANNYHLPVQQSLWKSFTMRQINSLAFSVFWKREIVRRLCAPTIVLLKLIFYKSKGGKSTSTIVKKIYISTIFYHYFLHSTMLFPYFSPSTMTFTFYISTTFLAFFLHSTSSKMAKSTIYSNPTPPHVMQPSNYQKTYVPYH